MIDEEFIRTYLQTHDLTCDFCSYNLRGFSTLACPECSRPVRESFQRRYRFTRFYWLGLLGLVLGELSAVIVLALAWLVRANSTGSVQWVPVTLLLALGCAAASFVMLLRWEKRGMLLRKGHPHVGREVMLCWAPLGVVVAAIALAML